MSKLNIVVFDGNSKFTLGGGQKITLSFCKALESDYQLFLYLIEDNPKLLQFISKKVNILNTTFRPKHITIFKLLFEIFTIFKILKKNNLNNVNTVIYLPSKKALLFTVFFRLFGFKVVSHIHSLNGFFIDNILKIFYRFSNIAIAPSEFVLKKIIIRNSIFINNPIDTYQYIKKDINFNTIGFVGSLEKHKGIDIFCRTAEILYSKNTNYRFIVLGDGSLRKNFENKYPFISFRGFVENVPEVVYKEFDSLVFPSVVPETFGLVVAEALSMNIPVLTFNLGCQAFLVKNYLSSEFVVNNISVDELVSRVEKINHSDKKNIIINYNMILKDCGFENFKASLLKTFRSLD